GIGATWRAVRRSLEMLIAEAAIAAGRQTETLTRHREVADQRLVVILIDLRSYRHLQRDIGTLPAGHVAAHAVHACLRLEVLLVAIIDQRIQSLDGLHPDVAAASAIAPIGTTELDELLAAERHRAGAAVTGADIDLGLVEEFHATAT